MRDNPVKAKLESGGTVFGTMILEFFTPGIARIARAAGAEFVLFDMEHSGIGMETVKSQMAFCRGLDIAPMVRVPAREAHFIARSLDLGAMGIMVPMVESAAQAEAVVEAVRYPPRGRRGSAFGVAHDDYEGGAVADKVAAADARTLVIALIETPEAIRNIDAIAAVDGIDVLWLGQSDLTSFMGIGGDFQHPGYRAAVEALVAAARRHGKVLGMMAGEPAMVRDYRARGFTMLGYGPDISLFQRTLAEGIRALKQA